MQYFTGTRFKAQQFVYDFLLRGFLQSKPEQLTYLLKRNMSETSGVVLNADLFAEALLRLALGLHIRWSVVKTLAGGWCTRVRLHQSCTFHVFLDVWIVVMSGVTTSSTLFCGHVFSMKSGCVRNRLNIFGQASWNFVRVDWLSSCVDCFLCISRVQGRIP